MIKHDSGISQFPSDFDAAGACPLVGPLPELSYDCKNS